MIQKTHNMVEVNLKSPGLLEKIAQPILNLWRGYSPTDLMNATRIFHGQITDEDRKQYIERRESYLKIAYFADPFQRECDRLPLGPATIYLYNEKLKALNELPPEQLDLKVKILAETNLRKWGKL